MLVLSRKSQEKIVVADKIIITVVQISPSRVRLGIEAPSEVRVIRKELMESGGGGT